MVVIYNAFLEVLTTIFFASCTLPCHPKTSVNADMTLYSRSTVGALDRASS
jgi:hypothetical protein